MRSTSKPGRCDQRCGRGGYPSHWRQAFDRFPSQRRVFACSVYPGTLRTAREVGLPTDRLLFESTENEQRIDTDHVRNIVASDRKMGFTKAIDDFGTGHAGLGLLAKFQTDLIKLDMDLIRSADQSEPRRIIVSGVGQYPGRLALPSLQRASRRQKNIRSCARLGSATCRATCWHARDLKAAGSPAIVRRTFGRCAAKGLRIRNEHAPRGLTGSRSPSLAYTDSS